MPDWVYVNPSPECCALTTHDYFAEVVYFSACLSVRLIVFLCACMSFIHLSVCLVCLSVLSFVDLSVT